MQSRNRTSISPLCMKNSLSSPSSSKILAKILLVLSVTSILINTTTSSENSNTTNATPSTDRYVHLIFSSAQLLSNKRTFSDCQNASDSSCSGGVAAVAAYSRYKSSGNNNNTIPTLVLPMFDYQSPFIQQHPLKWDANRLVMNHLLGWNVFLARSWFVGEEATRQRNIQGLQSTDWPLLLSNVAPPATNVWYDFTKGIFFDEETQLAVIHIVRDTGVTDYFYPKVESAKSRLDHIARVNQLSGCSKNENFYDLYTNWTSPVERKCWIPVLVEHLSEYDPENSLLEAVAEYENPPALYMDYTGMHPLLSEKPTQFGSRGRLWALRFRTNSDKFQQIKIELNDDRSWIHNATFEVEDIEEQLPAEVRDDRYASDIEFLRRLSDETIANDESVGYTNAFPVATGDNYRLCEAGECVYGNLFTDAYRWYTGSDIAFENSGAYHGIGWTEGAVRLSHLWGALPFSNNLCTGTISGISLYKAFNYSTSVASFSTSNIVGGGKLLQVSGMRVSYNPDLEVNRLIGLEIWNETEKRYLPLERLRMYKFVTNSYMCKNYDPFDKLLVSELNIPGESPGTIDPELAQEAVANYLTNLNNKTYNGRIEGRLVNDTSNMTVLNMVHTKENCGPQTYWVKDFVTCYQCPNISNVFLSLQDKIEFSGVSGDSSIEYGKVSIKNEETFSVDIHVKSTPSFLICDESQFSFCAEKEHITIEPRGAFLLSFGASPESQEPGTATGEVIFGVSDGGAHPGCIGDDVSFGVTLKTLPTKDLNQLGAIRNVGWALVAVATAVSVSFAAWCLIKKNHRVVKVMQPSFLVTLCFGVLVMASAIIPFSIDDEIVSTDGVDIACMSAAWLLSIGFSLSFSALFSKLWRINRIVNNAAHFRHLTLRGKDVLIPSFILCSINFGLLLSWTLVDPLRWERRHVEGEPWNTYGICVSNSNEVEVLFVVLLFFINAGALFLACWQAYKARHVPDQYSEAWGVGMAVFSFLQLALVGIPVLFLLDETSVIVVYFVKICLVFGLCMSLLLWIFVPMMRQVRKLQRDNCTGGTSVPFPSHRTTNGASNVAVPISLNVTIPRENRKVDDDKMKENQV